MTSFIIMKKTDYNGVISKLQNISIHKLVPAIICIQNIKEWSENTTLGRTCG